MAPNPVTVFVRDDDAGWEDGRLFALLDLFATHEAPIDLAVIPTELHPKLGGELLEFHADGAGRVGLHQHGYCHANHQPNGRKCEFGAARSFAAQYEDIAEGRRILAEQLGDVLDPIFTPPWNRCTANTGAALVELGIEVLSRDCTAEPLVVAALDELVIHVDWFAARNGVRLSRLQLGELLAERAAGPAPFGVLLHHAVMDTADFEGIDELLGVLTGNPNVAMRPMAEVAHGMKLKKRSTR